MDLHTINQQFGTLPTNAQQALRNWPHGVELRASTGWAPCLNPSWHPADTYRARRAPE